MYYKRFLFTLLSVATLLVLIPARPAYAAPFQEDEVIFGDDFILREGDHIDGDLVVIGGEVTLRNDSRVDGSVTVVGGQAEIDGAVYGDLVAIGGDVNLGSNARIEGDVVALGGRIRRAEGAFIAGSVVQGFAIRNIQFWRDLRLPLISTDVGFRPRSVLWSTVTTLGGAVFLSLLGMAIVALWPSQTSEVGRTIVTAPAPSLGVGCLVYPLALSLTLIILITICLAPFVPVVILLVIAAGLFGWIALGTLFGRWLARTIGWRTATPVAVTGLGVFTLSILAAVLGAIPCLGAILVLGASSIGLGAVALSRFGTRRYGVPVAPSATTTPPVETEPVADPVPPGELEPQISIEPPDEAALPADAEPLEEIEPPTDV